MREDREEGIERFASQVLFQKVCYKRFVSNDVLQKISLHKMISRISRISPAASAAPRRMPRGFLAPTHPAAAPERTSHRRGHSQNIRTSPKRRDARRRFSNENQKFQVRCFCIFLKILCIFIYFFINTKKLFLFFLDYFNSYLFVTYRFYRLDSHSPISRSQPRKQA